MSENIKLTCPRCKHIWETTIDDLERVETIYKLYENRQEKKVETYRASCPNDSTYIIIEVEEDDHA